MILGFPKLTHLSIAELDWDKEDVLIEFLKLCTDKLISLSLADMLINLEKTVASVPGTGGKKWHFLDVKTLLENYHESMVWSVKGI